VQKDLSKLFLPSNAPWKKKIYSILEWMILPQKIKPISKNFIEADHAIRKFRLNQIHRICEQRLPPATILVDIGRHHLGKEMRNNTSAAFTSQFLNILFVVKSPARSAGESVVNS
jgi:ABC-type phosphate/phosphonate transport system permease subunit